MFKWFTWKKFLNLIIGWAISEEVNKTSDKK